VARGDGAALARHLAALDEADPDLAGAYRAMAARAAHHSAAPDAVWDVLRSDDRKGSR
jgi:predicted short-subunit dehydrogenase-like oxidoreductase (DUF2520 family)